MNGTFANLEPPLELCPPRIEFSQLKAQNLVKTKGMEVVRLIVPKGKEIPPHRAAGELLIQCLSGRVAFTAMGETCELTPGRLLHLPPDKHHALRGLENSAVLLIVLHAANRGSEKDAVQEASEESFPASDPPAWNGARK